MDSQVYKEQDQETNTSFESKNKKTLWKWLFLYILIGAVLYLGVYYLSSSKQQVSQSSETEQTNTANEVSSKFEIILTNTGFNPSSLTVDAGTVVNFVNKSGSLATVNSQVDEDGNISELVDLGSLENGESVPVVFEDPGVYVFQNNLNPEQVGSIEVI